MDKSQTQETAVGISDTEAGSAPYRAPRVELLGTVADLTAGGTGTGFDTHGSFSG